MDNISNVLNATETDRENGVEKSIQPVDKEIIESFKALNTLDYTNFKNLKNNGILDSIKLSNCAIQCKISNINFNEKNIKDRFINAKEFNSITCNYWEIINEAVVVKPKSNRGRKKIVTIKKPRKRQGSGTDFNSQISFKVPWKNYYYNIKLFINGGMQIPGLKSIEEIDDIIICIAAILKYFADTNPKIVSIKPTMKNYKSCIISLASLGTVTNSQNKRVLNLIHLKKIVIAGKTKYKEGAYEYEPNEFMSDDNQKEFYDLLFDIKYDRLEETKITMLFSVDTKKKMTVKIFYSGKINFLGCFDNKYLLLVYSYLLMVVSKYERLLIVEEGIRA